MWDILLPQACKDARRVAERVLKRKGSKFSVDRQEAEKLASSVREHASNCPECEKWVRIRASEIKQFGL